MNTQVLYFETVRHLKDGHTLCRITQNIKSSDLYNMADNGYPITLVKVTRTKSVVSSQTYPVLDITKRSDADLIGTAEALVLKISGSSVNAAELEIAAGSALIRDDPSIDVDPDLLYIILPAQGDNI